MNMRPFFVSDYLLTFTGQIKLIMKLNLKLCAALIAGLLISINSFSQARLAIGGISSDNYLSSFNLTEKLESDYGAYIGILGDLRLGANSKMYLETGALYGYVGLEKKTASEEIHTINVPLRLKYKTPVTAEGDFFFFGGARAQYGISARIKEKNLSWSMYDEAFPYGCLNRMDVKVGFGCGIAVSMLEIRLGYEWGLMDQTTDDVIHLKVNQFFVGVAFNL